MSSGKGSVRNILRNTGWLLGGKGLSAVLSLGYLAIITRSLGVEGFGQFTLALGAGQGVALLVGFQSWQIVVRYGMPHLHAGAATELARLLRFTTWLDVAAALIGSIVVAVLMWLLGRHFGWDAQFIQLATACGVMMVVATHWTPIGVLRLHDRFATGAMADAMTPITRFAGALAVWLIHPTILGFLAVWALAELLTALAYWLAALRLPGVAWRVGEPVRWADIARENPGIGPYALMTNLNSSLDTGSRQVAVLMIGVLLSPAAVGGYRLAQQLAQALAKLTQSLARAIFPELMRSRAGDSQTARFEKLLGRTVRLTAAGGALVLLLLLAAGRPVLELVAGREFLSAYPVLLLLGAAAAIELAAVGFEPALVALGRPGLAVKLRCVTTTVLLGGVWLLTPPFGTIGAGASALAAALLSILLLWLALRRLLDGERAGAPSAQPVGKDL